MLVTCGTKAEVTAWLEALKNYVVHTQTSPSSKPVSLIVSIIHEVLVDRMLYIEQNKGIGVQTS